MLDQKLADALEAIICVASIESVGETGGQMLVYVW